MRIAEINTVHYGSTGKIMLQTAQVARARGHVVHTFAKSWKVNPNINEFHHYIGTLFSNVFQRIATPLTGMDGAFAVSSTQKLLRKLDVIAPDVIHLHNLHGWYLNYELLFRYIKRHRIRVVWTLHDCWAFTGQCPHFTATKCDKWRGGCHDCPQLHVYPQTCVDRTEVMWKQKKEWFSGVEDMTLVTPSRWLAGIVGQSFLGKYPVRVIHNGIDLNVFRPTPSDFRHRFGIPDEKRIILGVAFGWGYRKGLDVFIELARRLDTQKYQIVLVGTNEAVDKQLPDSIISIHRTQNQAELAQIYTAADLFVNPTREDNYPTVNMESIACGTPVLTFRTGGSPEIVDEKTGHVVDCDDIDAMEREIIRTCMHMRYSQADCLERAREFDMHCRFEEYARLYEHD